MVFLLVVEVVFGFVLDILVLILLEVIGVECGFLLIRNVVVFKELVVLVVRFFLLLYFVLIFYFCLVNVVFFFRCLSFIFCLCLYVI